MLDGYEKIVKDWAAPLLVITTVFLVKYLVLGFRNSYKTICRKFCIAVLVGLLANNYFLEYDGITPALALIALSVLTLLADGLVFGVIHINRRMRHDPIGLAKDIRDIFRR